MDAMFCLSLMTIGFCLLFIIPYIALCTWLWTSYRRGGGRKSWWRYIGEDC